VSTTTSENNRRATRQRVLKTAKVYRLNGAHAVDCQVRDISETGARLVVKDQLALPNEFKFVLPNDGFMQIAKVVWRRGDLAGIVFLSERTAAPVERLQNGSML
jgi:PilZ domain